jgi:hypothetical protein
MESGSAGDPANVHELGIPAVEAAHEEEGE